MTGAAFAIGAGNMNGFELLMGLLQKFAKGQRIGEILLISSGPYPAEHGKPGIQVIERFLVIHLCKYREGGMSSALRINSSLLANEDKLSTYYPNYCTLKLNGTITTDSWSDLLN